MALVHTDKGRDTLKCMENYGRKSKIFLDQQVIVQSIMTESLWKSGSVKMMIYLWKKTLKFCNIIIVMKVCTN